jgi:hypothetical protein
MAWLLSLLLCRMDKGTASNIFWLSDALYNFGSNGSSTASSRSTILP